MAHSRKFLTVAALGVGALALIGTGAGATFSDAVHGDQTITAGTMSLAISYANGSSADVSSDGRTLILPAFGPTNSTFETQNKIIRVTNNGNIPVKSLAFQMTEKHTNTDASIALLNQVNVCIKETDFSGTWVEGNGPLMKGVSLVPSVLENAIPLAVGASLDFTVDYYAGQDSTTVLGAVSCGHVTSDGLNTQHAWGDPSDVWSDTTFYTTPVSLTNAAMGGVITPSLTFSFTG